MWSKLKVGIIVAILLVFLYCISYIVYFLDRKYELKNKYGIPINCFSTALCGMNGNILLLFCIYLFIPDVYYEHILDLLDPKKLNKTVDDDIFNINALKAKLI